MAEVGRRFGRNLARCRRQKSISQEELGFRAGLHRTEVGMLERGVRLPRLDTFVKLKDSLGVSANDLVSGIAWTPPDLTEGRWGVGAPECDDESAGV